MTTASRTMTADELLALPEDGIRRELVEGELREMTPAGRKHGRIAMNVSTPLDQHVRSRGLGEVYAAETGFRLARDPDTVRAPDVSFVRTARLGAGGDENAFFDGAPDLALEVVSPSDRYAGVLEKVRDYLDAGTSCAIVVDPSSRTVTVYRSRSDVTVLGDGDTLKVDDVVPGWTLPVREIFA